MSNSKKVLIITYYWPPAGGPGVQRVLKFAKYLPQFGYEPIILTVKDGEYPSADESLLNDISDDIKVYKVAEFSVVSIYRRLFGIKDGLPTHVLSKGKQQSMAKRLAVWMRINLFIPDARLFWSRSIASQGLDIIREVQPDIIFSSSPPHSMQNGARKLAQKTGVKWVIDFRDPWTDGFWLKGLGRLSWMDKIDSWMELKAITCCDAITTVGPSLSKLFLSKGAQRVNVVYNGYDHEEISLQSGSLLNDTFRIVYTGSLRESQIPYKLLDSISALKNQPGSKTIQLEIYGTVHPDFIQYCDSNNISDQITYHGYQSHDSVLKEMSTADLLLLLIPNTPNNEGIITGKIFEYIGSGRPILGIGPTDGDAAKILSDFDNSSFMNYDDNLKELLKEYVGGKVKLLNTESPMRSAYSRLKQTEKLASLFNELLES